MTHAKWSVPALVLTLLGFAFAAVGWIGVSHDMAEHGERGYEASPLSMPGIIGALLCLFPGFILTIVALSNPEGKKTIPYVALSLYVAGALAVLGFFYFG